MWEWGRGNSVNWIYVKLYIDCMVGYICWHCKHGLHKFHSHIIGHVLAGVSRPPHILQPLLVCPQGWPLLSVQCLFTRIDLPIHRFSSEGYQTGFAWDVETAGWALCRWCTQPPWRSASRYTRWQYAWWGRNSILAPPPIEWARWSHSL